MKLRKEIKIGIFVAIFAALFNPFSIRIFYEYLDDFFAKKEFREMYADDNPNITSDGEKIDESEVKNLKGSDLSGENYGFDTKYFPYFAMLNDNEQKLYKQIYANANELVETFLPNVEVSIDEVKNTFEAVYNDHPELFWVNTSYSYKYTQSNHVVQIILSYNETSNNIEKSKELFYGEVNRLVNNANRYSTNYEKEKYVHDYIVNNVKYDKNASMNQSAYSALINKKTICAGYSRAFQFIMIQLQIPTYYVVGVSSVNHAWNMVKLDDGYYNVDLTWDNSDITRYRYFNRTDRDFSSSHKRTGLSLKLHSCTATKYRNFTVNKIDFSSNSNKIVNSNSSVGVTNNVASNDNKSNENVIVNNSNNNVNNSNNVSNDNVESNVVQPENSNSDNNIEHSNSLSRSNRRRSDFNPNKTSNNEESHTTEPTLPPDDDVEEELNNE